MSSVAAAGKAKVGSVETPVRIAFPPRPPHAIARPTGSTSLLGVFPAAPAASRRANGGFVEHGIADVFIALAMLVVVILVWMH